MPAQHFLGSVGRRAICSFPHTSNKRIRKLFYMYTKSISPLEIWLGRGAPLNPYLLGILREKAVAPKDLRVPPEGVITDEAVDFAEYTVRLG